MELKDIASVSGKSGLYKVLKPTRTGVILESMDEKKSKLVANINSRVSVLNEISIYTTTQDGSVPLEDVFVKIKKEFGEDPGVGSSSSSDELKSFFKFILPDYDPERVYVSDMKKVISWYSLLLKVAPEVMEEKADQPEEEKENDNKEGDKA